MQSAEVRWSLRVSLTPSDRPVDWLSPYPLRERTMFKNETPEARDRRLGKMTKEQKRGVALFVAIWFGMWCVAITVPVGSFALVLLAVGVR